MRILRLLLLVLGIFALGGIIVCVARSDYRGFGSGATTTLLIWAGYFIVTYASKQGATSRYKGGLACVSCGKRVEGRDGLMAAQSYEVQAGQTQKAAELENNQGYLCQSCGNIYCKICLSRRASSPQEGVACPDCGSVFGYLP